MPGSEAGHDDHRTAPELSGHCLSTAKVTGSDKGHNNHEIVSKELEHYLGYAKVNGPLVEH